MKDIVLVKLKTLPDCTGVEVMQDVYKGVSDIQSVCTGMAGRLPYFKRVAGILPIVAEEKICSNDIYRKRYP